jgi:hypothetical protein
VQGQLPEGGASQGQHLTHASRRERESQQAVLLLLLLRLAFWLGMVACWLLSNGE